MSAPSIDEYKEIRKAIESLVEDIGKFFTNAMIASVALITGVGALLTKSEAGSPLHGNPISAYFFIAPPLIVIAILYLLASHRRGIHRLASYIEVFYEEEDSSIAFERRLEKFRQHIHSGESLDVIPFAFWVVLLLSFGLYWLALQSICALHPVHLIIPAIETLLLGVGHYCFAKAIDQRPIYKNIWVTLKKDERANEKDEGAALDIGQR
jgi:hypothetical protein